MQDINYSTEIQCPYCWEMITVEVDNCGEDQQYIEDCQVCCRPISFHVAINQDQQIQLNVYDENE